MKDLLEKLLSKFSDIRFVYIGDNIVNINIDIKDLDNSDVAIPNNFDYKYEDNVKIVTMTCINLINSTDFRMKMLKQYNDQIENKDNSEIEA